MHRHREAMGSVRWMETERRKRLTWRILFIWQLFITFSRYWNSFFRISKHYYAYMSYFGILILSLSHIRTFFEVCDAPSPPSTFVSLNTFTITCHCLYANCSYMSFARWMWDISCASYFAHFHSEWTGGTSAEKWFNSSNVSAFYFIQMVSVQF